MQPNRQWLNKAALAGAAALVLIVVSFGSYQAGRSSNPPAQAKAVCPSPQDAASVAKRNIVWRALNMDETLPESPEKVLGQIVGIMINPKVSPENRSIAMPAYLYKSARYFSEQELAEVEAMLNSDQPLQRAEALNRIVGFDSEAAALVHQILADKARIGLLAEGQQIPLEEVPQPPSGGQ